MCYSTIDKVSEAEHACTGNHTYRRATAQTPNNFHRKNLTNQRLKGRNKDNSQ